MEEAVLNEGESLLTDSWSVMTIRAHLYEKLATSAGKFEVAAHLSLSDYGVWPQEAVHRRSQVRV